ncbi:hypothetical protein Tco_1289269, partial [Tanacetum coccineum]
MERGTNPSNSFVLVEGLEIRDNHLWHDHEVHLVHLVELYGDYPRSQGQSLHASRPSRLCARARSVDDMPFRTRACMGCTRWVFCKLYGRPKERHLVYPTKMHGPFKNSFQATIGYLNLPTCLWVIRGREM